jgi:ABC-2 type transport system permease protein
VRAAWIIARKDLALRMRDRSVLIIGVIAPLTLAFIFNLVFGGSINDVGESITLEMGVADEDGGAVADAFDGVLESLVGVGLVELTRYEDAPRARAAAESGEVGVVFVLPAGLSGAIRSGVDAEIEVVGNVDAPTTTDIAGAIARQFAAGVRRAGLSAVTAVDTGVVDASEMAAAASEAGAAAPTLSLGDVAAVTRQLDTATYFVAGLSVFFIFFIAGLSVTDMLEERHDGTLARLMAAPIMRGSIIAGKSITSVVIGLVSMTVLVVTSRFLMGAAWGPPLAVAVLVGSAVVAVVAIMTCVGGFAKTAEQAGNLQAIVAVTFGMLGGTFVPISEGDGLLATLRFATPNGWFMRGLGDIAGGEASAALPAVAALATMAVVFGLAASALVKRLVRT